MKIFIVLLSLLAPALSWGRDLSFHIQTEPHSLNPAHIYGSSGRYLFHALYQTLVKYDNDNGLIPYAAKSCDYLTPSLIQCRLNSNLKFSNGQPILADNYIWAIQRLLLPQTKTIQSELVLNIKHAKAILNQKMPLKNLGLKKINSTTFTIELAQPDKEFLYNFLHPALSPLPSLNYDFPKKN